jgi:hypothetical protein
MMPGKVFVVIANGGGRRYNNRERLIGRLTHRICSVDRKVECSIGGVPVMAPVPVFKLQTGRRHLRIEV